MHDSLVMGNPGVVYLYVKQLLAALPEHVINTCFTCTLYSDLKMTVYRNTHALNFFISANHDLYRITEVLLNF